MIAPAQYVATVLYLARPSEEMSAPYPSLRRQLGKGYGADAVGQGIRMPSSANQQCAADRPPAEVGRN
ncbi:MAG: hypothetical protein ACREQY_21340, partial [Candidatus Binatia bacterium]